MEIAGFIGPERVQENLTDEMENCERDMIPDEVPGMPYVNGYPALPKTGP